MARATFDNIKVGTILIRRHDHKAFVVQGITDTWVHCKDPLNPEPHHYIGAHNLKYHDVDSSQQENMQHKATPHEETINTLHEMLNSTVEGINKKEHELSILRDRVDSLLAVIKSYENGGAK